MNVQFTNSWPRVYKANVFLHRMRAWTLILLNWIKIQFSWVSALKCLIRFISSWILCAWIFSNAKIHKIYTGNKNTGLTAEQKPRQESHYFTTLSYSINGSKLVHLQQWTCGLWQGSPSDWRRRRGGTGLWTASKQQKHVSVNVPTFPLGRQTVTLQQKKKNNGKHFQVHSYWCATGSDGRRVVVSMLFL